MLACVDVDFSYRDPMIQGAINYVKNVGGTNMNMYNMLQKRIATIAKHKPYDPNLILWNIVPHIQQIFLYPTYTDIETSLLFQIYNPTSSYFVVSLIRNMNGVKIKNKVHVNERIGNYRAISIIIHCGTKSSNGHYIAFVFEDNWFMYDDNKKPVKILFKSFDEFNTFRYACGIYGTIERDATTILYKRQI